MAATEEAQVMAQVAEAVKGPDTPAAATVQSKPSWWTVVALIGAGPAISAILCWCIWILAREFWPDAVNLKALGTMDKIVGAVAIIAWTLAALLGVLIFRLASGGLKRIEAKAGPAGITLDTGGG